MSRRSRLARSAESPKPPKGISRPRRARRATGRSSKNPPRNVHHSHPRCGSPEPPGGGVGEGVSDQHASAVSQTRCLRLWRLRFPLAQPMIRLSSCEAAPPALDPGQQSNSGGPVSGANAPHKTWCLRGGPVSAGAIADCVSRTREPGNVRSTEACLFRDLGRPLRADTRDQGFVSMWRAAAQFADSGGRGTGCPVRPQHDFTRVSHQGFLLRSRGLTLGISHGVHADGLGRANAAARRHW
jgi:hypothetical protein